MSEGQSAWLGACMSFFYICRWIRCSAQLPARQDRMSMACSQLCIGTAGIMSQPSAVEEVETQRKQPASSPILKQAVINPWWLPRSPLVFNTLAHLSSFALWHPPRESPFHTHSSLGNSALVALVLLSPACKALLIALSAMSLNLIFGFDFYSLF